MNDMHVVPGLHVDWLEGVCVCVWGGGGGLATDVQLYYVNHLIY